MATMFNGLSASQWVDHCITVARKVHQDVRDHLSVDRADALIPLTIGGKEGKRALTVDVVAEKECKRYFARFASQVFVIGEERMKEDLSLSHKDRVCILVDMLDGTDLVEMSIPMWCSAMVVFYPAQQKIIGAVVALASGEIYSANCDDAFAMVMRNPISPEVSQHNLSMSTQVDGPSNAKELKHSTICFYGQKASRLKAVFDVDSLRKKLVSIAEEEDATLRIHTLAGNPMMVKLVDRPRDEDGVLVGRGVDMVFDLKGQQPHDVVPGAYIAVKAGATLLTTKGEHITDAELGRLLMRPTSSFAYVLSSTEELGQELISALRAD